MRGGSWTRVSKFRPALTVSFTFLATALLGGAFAVQGGMHSESVVPAKLAAATSAASTSCPEVNVVFARGIRAATGDPVCANGVDGLAQISHATNGDTTLGAQPAATG
ncbi:MAG: hypothetical protein ABSA93_02650 [Streptosporangiaceae bacterium]|jgi:hypothetical protein